MLLSVALPVFGASVSAPNEEEPYYTVVFEDGILTLRLNPDKVYEVLRDGELTREELKKFIPEDILDTLTDGEGMSMSKLASLAANYVSADDLVEIYNMVPAEVFFEYFDISILTEIVTLDELLEVVPVDEILSDISEDDIKALINDEAFGLLLTDDVKNTILSDEFIEDLLADGSIVSEIANDEQLHDALKKLVDDGVIDEMLKDAAIKNAIITLAESDATVERFLMDQTAVTDVKNYLIAHTEKLNGDGNGVDHSTVGFLKCDAVINAVYNSDKVKLFLEEHVDPHVVIEDPNIYIDYDLLIDVYGITEDNFKAFIDSGDSGITYEILENYIDENQKLDIEALIANEDSFNLEAFCDYEDEETDRLKITVENLRKNGFITDSEVAILVSQNWEALFAEDSGVTVSDFVHEIGMHKILEHFGRDDMVELLGGYYGLIDRGYFSEEDVLKAIGSIDVAESATDDEKLIAGYKKLIGILLDVDGKLDEIIDIVGYERWKEYIKFEDVLNAAGKAAGKTEGDYADLARLYSIEHLAKVARAIGIRNIVDFAREHDIHKKIDVKATLKDVLDLALSKKDKVEPFARKLASCVSSFVTNEISVMYLNGKQIYKNGSFDLQAIVTTVAQAIPDVDKFLEMESGDVFCQLILSADVRGEEFKAGVAVEFIGDLTRLQKLAESRADYLRLDVTDELDVTAEVVIPAVASELYMRGLNSTRVPARLKTKILQFPTMTVDDMNALLRGLSDEEIADYSAEVMEKADEIKAKVYAELEERIGKDSEKLDAAKRKADEILDKVSDPKKLSALRDKGVTVLDKLSDKMGDVTVAEIYDGNGVFSFDRGFSVDLWALANKAVTLPEELYVVFDNDMTLSGSLDMTLTVNGLYKATITDASGVRSEYFLPAGISMSVLNKYTSVAYSFADEKMPAHDVSFVHEDLYALEFYDENGALIERIGYTESSDPDPTLYPEVPQKEGYTGVWSDFTLRSEKTIRIYPVYTANEYTAKYVASGSTYTNTVTVETRKLTMPADEKEGYFFNGWAVDVDDDGVIDLEKGDFFLIPDGEGKYLVPEGKTLPARNFIILSDKTRLDYTVTFMVSGEEYGKTTFNADERTIKLPDIDPTPAAKHIFDGWYLDTDEDGVGDEPIDDSFVPAFKDYTAYARFRRVGYTATFEPVGDFGGTVIEFEVGDTELENVPAVPQKEGYKDGAWYVRIDGADDVPLSEYTPLGEGDITLYAKYTPIIYTIQFVVGSEIIDTVSFDLENGLERDPVGVPVKTGYTAAWADFELKAESFMVSAVYTPIKYTASFVVNGEIIKTIEFTVETETLEGVPAVPEKPGYAGKWSEYKLEASDLTIEAEYTVITYKAEFMADGVLVGTVNFTINDSSITEPEVPYKEGYEGRWEEYVLHTEDAISDIVINAVYTEIPPIVVNPDQRGMGTFWWILLAVLVMMLIIWIISKNAEEQTEPEPTPEPETAPVVVPEPEEEPVAEVVPEPAAEPEPVESIDVETADKLMSDETAATVIETVGGAGVGAKAIINISDINAAFSDGDTVDIDALKAKKLIPAKTQRIKVLADGTLDKVLTVYAEQFSVQAIKMITLTGGKAIQKK